MVAAQLRHRHVRGHAEVMTEAPVLRLLVAHGSSAREARREPMGFVRRHLGELAHAQRQGGAD